MIFTSLVSYLFIINSAYAYTSEMNNGAAPAQPSAAAQPQEPVTASTAATAGQAVHTTTTTQDVAIAPAQASAPAASTKKTAKKKNWSNLFGLLDIISNLESFVKGKTKQNENVIEAAASGNFEVSHKRAIAADPAARRIQEKMDKAQAERLQKLEDVVGK